MLAPLREDERLPCAGAVRCVVDHGVVITRLQQRSLNAEPKDDKLVSSNVFLVEAASYVSCCCCRSGRILGPIEDLGVDVQRKMITVAELPEQFLLRKRRVGRDRLERKSTWQVK